MMSSAMSDLQQFFVPDNLAILSLTFIGGVWVGYAGTPRQSRLWALGWPALSFVLGVMVLVMPPAESREPQLGYLTWQDAKAIETILATVVTLVVAAVGSLSGYCVRRTRNGVNRASRLDVSRPDSTEARQPHLTTTGRTGGHHAWINPR